MLFEDDFLKYHISTPRRADIKPVLASLHWLPVRQRMVYKVAALFHKIRSTSCPPYLLDLLVDYRPSRSLHSSSKNLLVERKSKFRNSASAFGVTAPRIRNSLPDSLRQNDSKESFKTGLKTHLFQLAFGELHK